MKTRLTSPSDSAPTPDGFPDADSLAALRAWYAGLPTREAVARYLPGSAAMGQSARGILGRIRRQLVAVARSLHREDLAMPFGVFVLFVQFLAVIACRAPASKDFLCCNISSKHEFTKSMINKHF
jgi:hypothetical protein